MRMLNRFHQMARQSQKSRPSRKYRRLMDRTAANSHTLWKLAILRSQELDPYNPVFPNTLRHRPLKDFIHFLQRKTRCWPSTTAQVPKKDGTLRDIFIPDVIDRIRQTGIMLLLQPWYEWSLDPKAIGFRARHDRIRGMALFAQGAFHHFGNKAIFLDADFKKYFNTIDWKDLRKAIKVAFAGRIQRYVLSMMSSQAKGPLSDGTKAEDQRRTTGVPQGSVLGPALSNLVLQAWDMRLNRAGLWWVRYADNLTIAFLRPETGRDPIGARMESEKTH